MINDLPTNKMKTDATLFADDSCLFTSGRNLNSIVNKMQDSLNKLVQWCNLNGFKISMNKTVAVLFTRRRDRIDRILKINGESVKIENKAKFLGIIFDSQLNWNSHVSYIVDKCKKRLNLLYGRYPEINGEPTKKTLLMIYRSLIRSILDYGAVALDSMSESNKKKLDVIQMKACLLYTSPSPRDRTRSRMPSSA